jgi:hypothetical protein
MISANSVIYRILKLIKATFSNIGRGYIDFFYFPFNIHRPLPPDSLFYLRSIVSWLNSKAIRYFLTDGTVLGLIRDQRLIPHDTDLDISITSTLDLSKISLYLLFSGWRPGRVVMYFLKPQQVTFYNQGIVLDFTLWRPCSANPEYFIHSVPEVNGPSMQLASFYSHQQFYCVSGFSFASHPQIIDWFETRYGPDWNVPSSSKGDWISETFDIRSSCSVSADCSADKKV